MMKIRNERDLRSAYYIVNSLTELRKERGYSEDTENIKELKRDIRRYTHRESDRRCIQDDPYGYYTMLIECPEWVNTKEDDEEWFEEEEKMVYMPSPYDCTGQHFTLWYKFVERRGKWYCYHHVGVDI